MKSTLRGVSRRVGEHLRFRGVAYAVLLISLFLTFLTYTYARQSLDTQNNARFRDTISTSERVIQRRTDAYVTALFGARAFLTTSKNIGESGWEGYIDGLDIRESYRGFQALGYVPYLDSKAARLSYESAARKGGLITRPKALPGGSGTGASVEYIGPLDQANRLFAGSDHYAVDAHREAMDRARDTGQPEATGRVYVLTEAPPGASADLALQPGFFVYLPVYKGGATPRTVEGRRRAIQGFVFGSFRMDKLLGGVLSGRETSNLDFEVYDGENVSPDGLLYDKDGVLRATDPTASPEHSKVDRIRIAGREWSLYFAALSGFAGAAETLPVLVLVSGCLVSLALFLATWLLATSRERAERASAASEEANRNLEAANEELEAFSYSVSHDLRAPLRSIEGFSQVLVEDYSGALDEQGLGYLGRVKGASRRMSELIDDLLELSRVSRVPLKRTEVDPAAVAREVAEALARHDPQRKVEWNIKDVPKTSGDRRLLRVILENLLANAWKFTATEENPTVEFGALRRGGVFAYYVRDNGAGFEMAYTDKLFGAFQRLHSQDEFEGTGIGLATVARIIRRHGGEVWAEGEVGKGATFYFTLEPPRKG